MGDVLPLPRDVLRSRRKRAVRAKTVSSRRTTKRELRHLRVLADAYMDDVGPVERPRTRADCVDGLRPCPWVSCKHHLFLDVSPATGAVKMNFPDIEPGDLPADGSCALDVTDRGEQTLEKVADLTNVTRERIRQVEEKVLRRLFVNAPPALREHAGAFGERTSTRFNSMLRGEYATAARAMPPPDEPEERCDGHRDTVSWTHRLSAEDSLEAARWGAIAGHLFRVHRVPLAVACQRASEYVEEFPGEMPEGVEFVLSEKRRGPVVSLATPPDRLMATPEPIGLPRESAHSGLEQLIERGAHVDLPVGDESDAQPVERALGRNEKRRGSPRVSAPVPKPVGDPLPARIRAALADGQARTTAEVARCIGASVKIASSILNRMRRRGEVTRDAPWRLVRKEAV